MKQLSISIIALAFLASCGQAPQQAESETETPMEEKELTCQYMFNADSTMVSWTAFKTTEKIGVDGKFDEIAISGTSTASVAQDVFANASFEIPISSINTANPDRDKKIQTFFFGSLAGSETLSGKLLSLEGNKGTVAIIMNGVEKQVEMDYSMENDAVLLETTINVGEWNAQAGIESLNKECYELHMAGDGVSKLWPEVAIRIRSVLNKTCE